MINKFFRRYLIVIFILVLVIVLGYFYKNKITYEDPEAAAKREVISLVEEVGKLVLLPIGETPTLARVSDPEPLKNQAFFSEAEKGDRVLIYTNAKKAILYRPSLHLVINIAPVNLGNFGASAVSPSEATFYPPGEF